jgi:hypothetical protein
MGKKAQGEAALKKSCEMKDPWGCDLAKRLR